MRQPLVPPVLALAGGILVSDRWPVSIPAAVAGIAAAAALIAVPRLRTPALWLLCLAAGLLHHTLWQAPLNPADVRHVTPAEPVIGRIEAVLLEPPRVRPAHARDRSGGRLTVLARAMAWIPADGIRQPVRGRVMISSPGPPDDGLWRGRRVRVDGVLRPPPEARAPGLFDYRRHLAVRGVHRQMVADGPADWFLPGPSPGRPPLLERWRRGAHEVLARGLPDDEAARLIRGMLLGWRTALTEELEEPFMRTGTLHLFAISGLHLALIAALLVQALRMARVPRAGCGLVALPLVWAFVAMTGWTPSAVRAAVMASVVTGGWLLARPPDLLNSLALAAALLLAWDPGQLFHIGFQFSFLVVTGLALLIPPIQAGLLRGFRPDPLVPDELRPRWHRWLAGPVRALGANVATAVAAWVAALPLALHHFHLLNPVALLANVAVVPLAGLALTAAVAALAAGILAPPLVPWCTASAWFWVRCQLAVVERLAALPGGAWWVAAPHAGWWAVYYAAIGLALASRRIPRRWLRAGTAALALAATGLAVRSLRPDPRLHLTVLPGGGALVATGPAAADRLVLDGGSAGTVEFITLPYLRGEGWNSIPAHAVTHGEQRFVGGVPELLRALPADRTAVPDARLRGPAFRRHLADLTPGAPPPTPLARGTEWCGWTVLHPDPSDRFTRSDDNAVVLRRVFAGHRILLLSALGRGGQRRLMERETDLRADVVVAAVPSDGRVLPDDLLDRIGARWVVVATGDYPASARADRNQRQRLARRPEVPLFTDLCGAVSLAIGPDGIALSTGTRRPPPP